MPAAYPQKMTTTDFAAVLQLPVQQRMRMVEVSWNSGADAVAVQGWQAAERALRLADFKANPSAEVSWAEDRRPVMAAA